MYSTWVNLKFPVAVNKYKYKRKGWQKGRIKILLIVKLISIMYLLIFFNIVYAWGINISLSNIKIPYEVILSVLAMVTVENYAKNYNTV